MTTPKAGGQPVDGKRWPAVTALVAMPFTPRLCAQRTSHCGLAVAAGIHVVGALLLILGILVTSNWHDVTGAGAGLVWAVQNDLDDMLQALRDPEVVIWTGVTIVSIEIGVVVAATLLCAWGAGDEKVVDSWKRSLSRVWLASAAAVWIVSIALLATEGLSHVEDRYDSRYRAEHPEPESPWQLNLPQAATAPGATPGAPIVAVPSPTQAQIDAYSEAHEKWWRQYRVARAQWPWYVRHRYEVATGLTMAAFAWGVAALLSAVGAPARHVAPPWPPTCEGCGYNLTMAHADAACPECGLAVAASLAEDRRRGTPWQRRHELGRARALALTWRLTLLRPRALGAAMQVRRFSMDHRRMFLTHLLLVLLTFTGGYVVNTGLWWRIPSWWSLENLIFSFTLLGLWIAVAIPATSGIIGLGATISARRNMLFAAAQASSHMGVYVAGWVAMTWLLHWAIDWMSDSNILEGLFRSLNIDDWIVFASIAIAVQITLLVGYFAIMRRIVMAMRYANR